jgi:hypothetical protein
MDGESKVAQSLNKGKVGLGINFSFPRISIARIKLRWPVCRAQGSLIQQLFQARSNKHISRGGKCRSTTPTSHSASWRLN